MKNKRKALIWKTEGKYQVCYLSLENYTPLNSHGSLWIDDVFVKTEDGVVGVLSEEDMAFLKQLNDTVVTYEVGQIKEGLGYLKIVVEQDPPEEVEFKKTVSKAFKTWKLVYYCTVLFLSLSVFFISLFYESYRISSVLLGIVVVATAYSFYDYIRSHKGETK